MSVKNKLISIINKLPYVRGLYQDSIRYKTNSCYPAGHYSSPIILVDDIKKRELSIWDKLEIDGIAGINLNTQHQIDLVKNELTEFYNEMPFTAQKQPNLRYYFKNDFYEYTDGIVLYSIMRHFKPKRIIEIGSGFSSAVMLDTNELFFKNEVDLTFIEPYPERLYSLIGDNEKKKNIIIESDVQLIGLEVFEKLEAGDILFVDSSHVAKTASDVNYILFEILPKLKSGVMIHFHDIFYPFEYPKKWVLEGRNWNEDYFLRAFLMYNDAFEIKLFSHYLHSLHKEAFDGMPLTHQNSGGNLWIEKK